MRVCGQRQFSVSYNRGEAGTLYRSRHTWDAVHTSHGPTEMSTSDVFCQLLRDDEMSSRRKVTVKEMRW